MEEVIELGNYLPLSFNDANEQEYIAFLWNAYENNYTSGTYEFASLALHLLYMSYTSFALWRIRATRERDFQRALIGFWQDAENKLLKAETPFKFYEILKESQIFRFLKLLDCANEQVGEFSKFVRRRNNIAHPSGTVFFNDQAKFDDEISSMLREVVNIHGHMRPVIIELYARFLRESAEPEEREYADPFEEIRINLIGKYYLSQKDVDICVGFDPASIADRPGDDYIRELHQALKAEYGSDGDDSA